MNKSMGESNGAQEKQYLGVDYGDSKVGLALADPETRIAFAYQTVENTEALMVKLTEIIDQENVGTVVIGLPTHNKREEVEFDGERLGKLIEKLPGNIRVEYQNEMFTTKMAQANLIESGLKNVKRFDDQEAARIILQEWLDRKSK